MDEAHPLFRIGTAWPAARAVLASLPLIALQPFLHYLVRSLARDRPEIAARLGPHSEKSFLIDPTNLPFVCLLRPHPHTLHCGRSAGGAALPTMLGSPARSSAWSTAGLKAMCSFSRANSSSKATPRLSSHCATRSTTSSAVSQTRSLRCSAPLRHPGPRCTSSDRQRQPCQVPRSERIGAHATVSARSWSVRPLHPPRCGTRSTPEEIRYYYHEFGIKSAVLPQILTIPEIKAVHESVPCEIEAFVFGNIGEKGIAAFRLFSRRMTWSKSPKSTEQCSIAAYRVQRPANASARRACGYPSRTASITARLAEASCRRAGRRTSSTDGLHGLLARRCLMGCPALANSARRIAFDPLVVAAHWFALKDLSAESSPRSRPADPDTAWHYNCSPLRNRVGERPCATATCWTASRRSPTTRRSQT